MKALKTCKTGCGKMQSGGPVKKVKKMAHGGQMYGIPQTGTTNYSAPTMARGGKVTMLKKKGMGGMHMMPDGTMMKDSMMKKGGMVRKKKLAVLAPPTNKITRADVIAGALKNKRKKK